MKTKLTEERQDSICRFIRAGNYAVVAAGCAGIEERTYYNWLKRGEEAKSGIFLQFFQAVKKAKDDAEAERVLKIRSVAMGEAPAELIEIKDKKTGEVTRQITKYMKPDWFAAAWLLERQHPARWAKREKIEVTGKDGQELPPPVVVFNMPEGVVIRPPRNGDEGNGSGTIALQAGQQSGN